MTESTSDWIHRMMGKRPPTTEEGDADSEAEVSAEVEAPLTMSD